MTTKTRTFMTLGALLAVLTFGASSASAETLEPWFHLASVARPGNLSAGQGRDEVQELKVNATGGDVLWAVASNPFVDFAYNASHEVVQASLESVYGADNVEVAGGCREEVPPLSECAYTITFKKALGERSVALPEESLFGLAGYFGGSALEGEAIVTDVAEGKPDGVIVVTAVNVGDGDANGEAVPLKLSDVLPAHLTPLSIEGNTFNNGGVSRGPVQCELGTLTCTFKEGCPVVEPGSCPVAQALLPPFEQIEVAIGVEVQQGASSGEQNRVSVSGGGAPEAHLSHPLTFASKPGEATPFGVETYEQSLEEAGGAGDAQAGSHAFQFTTTLNLNQVPTFDPIASREVGAPAALAKDLSFKLPAGLIGNPTAYPRCSVTQFSAHECPADTVIGVATVTLADDADGGRAGLFTSPNPIFNLAPSEGEPARFAFAPAGVPVFLDTSVRTGSDYGVTVHAGNIPQTVGFLSNTVTFWGVPGDSRHDDARGDSCLLESEGESANGHPPCLPLEASNPPPFLSLPTSCTGPLLDTAQADSWAEPDRSISFSSEPREAPFEGVMPAMDGCGLLPFSSEIKVSPDVEAGSTPSGLNVDVHVPQEEALNATGLAPAMLKNITVTLPQGLELNPSAADGLEACTQAEVGLDNDNQVTCPNGSKVANVTIKSPLLPLGQYLYGFMYLASPQNFAAGLEENPFKRHVAMYLVAYDKISGTLVKLPGSVELGGEPGVTGLAPGQIRSIFQNNPQLPFEDAEIEFFGGERAPLDTPALCQPYTTNATFEPWTNGGAVDEALSSNSTFDISSGPGGSACANPLPFNASLSSGSTSNNAGGFSALSTTLSRPSGDQSIQSVTLHYPPGLSGLLSGVELCPEAQANAGTCGPDSQIGETIVSVGVGGDPFTVTGGKAYITGPYEGAPFGLSIVNPAKAGPFDLQEGRPVVVRAKIEVNPITAALTITTNGPLEGHSIPSIIEGFALQIQHVNVNVNRPGFTFNPTNCNPTEITGVLNSAEGASAAVKNQFEVTNCAALKFEPKFTVTTSGKTSKVDGASLTTTVSEPAGALGAQANIAYVKVELPKTLPSRLTTLQKACTSAQFELNPAGCPAASDIGHAVVHTPLLPVPLEGPAIFVSHGGEAFPSLTMVLQGYGVTIDLVGTTFISKSGITSTTFKAVPDTPFNSFQLTLPEGPYSALAANGNLCQQKLVMPTAFVAQDGATLNQNTSIKIEGCPNTLSLISKHLGKNTLKLSVAVPSSGKLTADGVGLSKVTKSANGRETITVRLKVKPTKAQARRRVHHHALKLVDHVKLTFRLANGKKLTKTFSAMV